MAFDLCFAPEFFFNEGEPYDGGPDPSETPTSVWHAIISEMEKPEGRERLAEAVGCDCPEYLTPETVLDHIREVNTCGQLHSPVDVWVSRDGWVRLDVYDVK